jgi:hypothetical protein
MVVSFNMGFARVTLRGGSIILDGRSVQRRYAQYVFAVDVSRVVGLRLYMAARC